MFACARALLDAPVSGAKRDRLGSDDGDARELYHGSEDESEDELKFPKPPPDDDEDDDDDVNPKQLPIVLYQDETKE